MPIDIHIRLEPGENLQDVLRYHGLLPGPSWRPAPEQAKEVARTVPAYDGEPPIAEQTFGPLPEAEAPAPAAEPPKRGRPRKPAEAPEVRYTVRRFGGDAESVHTDAQAAADRLLELIAEAGDPAALEELMQHNEAMVASLPSVVAEIVRAAAETEMARLAPENAPVPVEPEPAAPAYDPEPPAHPAWPLDERQQPLLSITPDKQGARNAILAIATGSSPKFGHAVGLALLEKHGVAKLRDIADDADPKHAAIATDAAALLGLPMEGLL